MRSNSGKKRDSSPDAEYGAGVNGHCVLVIADSFSVEEVKVAVGVLEALLHRKDPSVLVRNPAYGKLLRKFHVMRDKAREAGQL